MSVPDNQYATLLEALESAATRGFSLHFMFRDGMMLCEETGEIFSPQDLRIEEFHRLEGHSDPDESAIVYLLVSKGQCRGTLVDSYGAQAQTELAEFLSSIPIDRSETATPVPKKHCLNCGAELHGVFCSSCGQKDEHLREPFWKMSVHFFGDFFHFDSRFMRSIVPLLFRPGFLTREFIAGRRARYMKPIQLYIFISLTFFLFYFSFGLKSPDDQATAVPDGDSAEYLSSYSDTTLLKEIQKATPYLPQLARDSIAAELKRHSLPDSLRIPGDSAPTDSLTRRMDLGEYEGVNFSLDDDLRLPRTIEEYEDSISKLPEDQKPAWYMKAVHKQQIKLNERARENPKEVMKDLFERFTHGIPKMVFLLLPIFALILKLFYLRHNVYFVDHAVFSLHFHSFIFLLFLLVLLVGLIIPGIIGLGITTMLILIYLILALRNLYRQSWLKTIFKVTGIVFLYFVALAVVAVIGLLYATFTI